ncbi:hypothetical protein [Klebsiella variicola]|uniref:hypothetical protein n=1 Tax=Klebsiella variicola TaxID=244366 RepID=UPI002B05561F|nr:hypothetical protein [Klebsiella variicola]
MKKVLIAAVLTTAPFLAIGDDSGVAKEGKWLMSKEENKLTDKVDIYGMLSASKGRGSLIIRCKNNTTDAYFSIDSYLGSDDSTAITTRIDGAKPVKSSWVMGEGGDAAFPPKALSFIKSLHGKKELIVGYRPYGKSQLISEFDLSGIDNVIDGVSAACGWKM